jgi:arginine deiminase
MPFGVHSEVGRLRKVMVHRPGLEHTRLTPSNAEDLLFDDVLWVARAKAEHDMFCEAMRERGIEVFEAEQLLTEALVKPDTKEWVCAHILNERQVGITASKRAQEWVDTAEAAQVAEFLIGGITKGTSHRTSACYGKPPIRRACWCRHCPTSCSNVTRPAGSTTG